MEFRSKPTNLAKTYRPTRGHVEDASLEPSQSQCTKRAARSPTPVSRLLWIRCPWSRPKRPYISPPMPSKSPAAVLPPKQRAAVAAAAALIVSTSGSTLSSTNSDVFDWDSASRSSVSTMDLPCHLRHSASKYNKGSDTTENPIERHHRSHSECSRSPPFDPDFELAAEAPDTDDGALMSYKNHSSDDFNTRLPSIHVDACLFTEDMFEELQRKLLCDVTDRKSKDLRSHDLRNSTTTITLDACCRSVEMKDSRTSLAYMRDSLNSFSASQRLPPIQLTPQDEALPDDAYAVFSPRIAQMRAEARESISTAITLMRANIASMDSPEYENGPPTVIVLPPTPVLSEMEYFIDPCPPARSSSREAMIKQSTTIISTSPSLTSDDGSMSDDEEDLDDIDALFDDLHRPLTPIRHNVSMLYDESALTRLAGQSCVGIEACRQANGEGQQELSTSARCLPDDLDARFADAAPDAHYVERLYREPTGDTHGALSVNPEPTVATNIDAISHGRSLSDDSVGSTASLEDAVVVMCERISIGCAV